MSIFRWIEGNKYIPEAAAVNVAHVPVVYQVPAEMMHPTELLPVLTFRNPLPSNTPVPVGAGGLVVVVVGGGLPPLGRYLTPVAGQVDLVPSMYRSRYISICYKTPCAVSRGEHTRISSNELASRHTAFHVKVIPNFIQFTTTAADGDRASIYSCQSSLDRGGCIGC